MYDFVYMKCSELVNSESKSKLVVVRGWKKEGIGSDCLMGTEFSLGPWNALELDRGGGGTAACSTGYHWISHFTIFILFYFLFFQNLFIFCLFIFWLHWVFIAARGLSLVAASGGYFRCGAWASYCGVFSCCRAWALGAQVPVVVAHGLSSCGSRAL